MALRAIALEVGGVAETVTVQAEAVTVQTTTAARSGMITRDNIEDIALKGRDFAGMLKLLPGVVDTANREAPGLGLDGRRLVDQRPHVVQLLLRRRHQQGHRLEQRQLRRARARLDRAKSACRPRTSRPSTAAAPARRSPSSPRSGTKDFHGSAAYYKRDDALNANEYDRKVACAAGQTVQCKPPATRSTTRRGRSAVRCSIPGTDFNKGRNKLFFFLSQDILQRTDPGGLNERRMPTALERKGDFSQTVDTQGGACSSATRSCRAPAASPAAARLLPRQHHSGQSHRPDGAGTAQPVPAADLRPERERQQLHVPDGAGLAAQRPGAARRLQRRAAHHRLRTAAVRL